MSDVSSGSILVADHQGVYVIKMQGDVRLTLCVSFDECIEELTSKDGFFTILFDVSEAEGLDSTTLGLMAKMAVNAQSQGRDKPIIICPDPGIKRLLQTMGLDEVCEVMEHSPETFCELDQTADNVISLEQVKEDQDEEQLRSKILEAHCVLMQLNETNRETFKDLVQTLQCG